jgi:hypothetical protein
MHRNIVFRCCLELTYALFKLSFCHEYSHILYDSPFGTAYCPSSQFIRTTDA